MGLVGGGGGGGGEGGEEGKGAEKNKQHAVTSWPAYSRSSGDGRLFCLCTRPEEPNSPKGTKLTKNQEQSTTVRNTPQ